MHRGKWEKSILKIGLSLANKSSSGKCCFREEHNELLIRKFSSYVKGKNQKSQNILMSRHLFIYKFFIFCQPTSILRVCGLSMMAYGKECCQCKGHEFNPWSRRIPRASEEVSPCITTIEPALYSLGSTAAEPSLCHYCSP